MKRMRFVFLIVVLNLVSFVGICQPGDPGGNPTVPITGLEVLLLVGGALGIKKILGKDKKNP
jgi:hypothetical protein